jgi:hypothetical protein
VKSNWPSKISREWIGSARSIGRGSESSVLIEPLLMDVTNDSECTICLVQLVAPKCQRDLRQTKAALIFRQNKF